MSGSMHTNITTMALLSVEQLSAYAAGHVYAHVIAIRVNTQQESDLLLVDYTRNSALNESSRFPFDTDLEMGLQVKAPIEMVTRLAQDYRKVFGGDMFDRNAARLRESSWIAMAGSFCLVRAQLKVSRRKTHLGGFTRSLALLSSAHVDCGAFVRRLVEHNPQFPSEAIYEKWWARFPPGTAPAKTAGVSREPPSQPDDGDSDGGHKFQKLSSAQRIKLEKNEHLRQMLQPVETQLLTQPSQFSQESQFLQSQERAMNQVDRTSQRDQNQRDQNQRDQTNHTIQTPQAHGDTNATSPGSPFSPSDPENSQFSLAALNRILSDSPDETVYSTRAFVVGSLPQDLTLVCTKNYVEVDGDIQLSDPLVRPLELYLADSTEKVLGPANSLVVHIPKEQVLPFFGCKFPEQLYTQLASFQERFRQRRKRWVALDLEAISVDGRPTWTLHKSRFEQLLKDS
ncbi:hypothetical protein EJF18_40119 [Clavispora lusitaniae]|uniref:Uncharacterized protein n=2 Tax=Clavispora lusitaniae TaxID=36911 RepID=C4Y585_CLAL4|nr:uncharacterized protein CLUG_03319 [Clavispora lusitaniae ATCC 42720]KAF5210116.1 hypothetical protein E0198_002977 [Clavispora lusitaniae]EEQ39191.1 predicted protein [Clavispora lusitaniae ATCC 42720]KAF7582816.1 hypothetical protein FOB63_002897 [Clavispora lusitaniae]QFZ28095.1 hypothetical protein EJF14_40119 [Clavispora lusitaniae]QFZ33758.1 hypothetical protein EJF16_40119 [Clavispora lusitaniae]